MRALLAITVLGASAGPMTAAALPPPPYAADPQFQAPPQYGAPQDAYRRPQGVYDRYSGGAAHPVAAPAAQYYSFGPQAGSPNAGAPVRTLGWSGKVEAAQQVSAPAPQGGWSRMSARWSAASPLQQQPQPSANQSWRPLYPSAGAAPAAQPHTIYDPPAAPQRQASAQTTTGPHFYSLHREYGIEPDPIPIPPKFFGPTADLSAPPADPVLKRVTDASGQTHTQAVPTDDQGG